VLVTGANGGIGVSICKMLLEQNAKLVMFYHEQRNKIDELIPNQTSVKAYQVDLLDNARLESVVSEILKNGYVDSFIHSVTLPIKNNDIAKMTWNDFQSNIDIQTKSFFTIVKLLLPSMKEKKFGRIIHIMSSATIGRPPSSISDYIVGKYSALGLCKSLAVEVGRYGITVNCISPAMTNTDLIENFPSKLKEIAISQTPLSRLAEPSDTSSIIQFLLSRSADYISGENILVAGAGTMH